MILAKLVNYPNYGIGLAVLKVWIDEFHLPIQSFIKQNSFQHRQKYEIRT
jgi:hypothetical protein